MTMERPRREDLEQRDLGTVDGLVVRPDDETGRDNGGDVEQALDVISVETRASRDIHQTYRSARHLKVV